MAKTNPQNKFSLNSFVAFINENFSLIIIALIIFIVGFLTGSLWTENQMLKSDNVAGTKQVNPDTATAPVDDTEALKNVPEVSKEDHMRGAKNAKVTMITYSDYECPYCNRWHPTSNDLLEKYADQINFVYRHFPLSFHPHAQKLAEVAECVADNAGEDAFWKFTENVYTKMADKSIYTTQGESQIITDETMLTLAANAGANQNQVKSCVDSGEKTAVVKAMMDGASAAGIGGTPSTVIISKKAGYELIPGALPLADVESMLEKHL